MRALTILQKGIPIFPELKDNSLSVALTNEEPLTFDAQYTATGGALAKLLGGMPSMRVDKDDAEVYHIIDGQEINWTTPTTLNYELTGLEKNVTYTAVPCIYIGDACYEWEGVDFSSEGNDDEGNDDEGNDDEGKDDEEEDNPDSELPDISGWWTFESDFFAFKSFGINWEPSDKEGWQYEAHGFFGIWTASCNVDADGTIHLQFRSPDNTQNFYGTLNEDFTVASGTYNYWGEYPWKMTR